MTEVLPILARGCWDTLFEAMQARPVSQWPPTAVEVGIDHCRQSLRATQALRLEYGERLHNGTDAKAFAAEIGPILAVVRPYVDASSGLAKELSGPISDSRLREFQLAFETMAREAADLLGFLEAALRTAMAPRAPIDWDRVRRAEDAYERGETKVFQRTAEPNGEE